MTRRPRSTSRDIGRKRRWHRLRGGAGARTASRRRPVEGHTRSSTAIGTSRRPGCSRRASSPCQPDGDTDPTIHCQLESINDSEHFMNQMSETNAC